MQSQRQRQEIGGGVAGTSNRLKKSVSAAINGMLRDNERGSAECGTTTPNTPQQTHPQGSDGVSDE